MTEPVFDTGWTKTKTDQRDSAELRPFPDENGGRLAVRLALGIPGREARGGPPDGPYHHLYVVVEGNQAHRDHVDLRDYLRRHPEQARRYAARKREIAFLLETHRAHTSRRKAIWSRSC